MDILRDREEEHKTDSSGDDDTSVEFTPWHCEATPFIKPVDEVFSNKTEGEGEGESEKQEYDPIDDAVVEEFLAIIQGKNQSAQEEGEEMPRPRVPVQDDYNVHIDVKAFPRDGEAYVQILEVPPVVKPVEELVKEVVVEPAEEPIESIVKEVVVEPVEEPVEETMEEPVEEPYTTEEITENFSRVFQRMEEMETEIKELREGVGALREILSRYNDIFTTIISLFPDVPPSKNTRFTDEETGDDEEAEGDEDGERNENEGNDENDEEDDEEEDNEDWFNDMCTVM